MMEAYGASHVGEVRGLNEDSFLVDVGLGLLVVADGMGGHAGGEVASRLAVETIRDGLQDCAPSRPAPDALLQALLASIQRAHEAIQRHASEDPNLQGMGTTLLTAVAVGSDMLVAHLGDSRAYLFCNGELQRLTEDHSLVAQLVRIGEINEAERHTHPQRHVITQALGVGESPSPELMRFHPHAGDVLVLCTDGLHGMIGDDRILERVKSGESPRDSCQALIADALAAGGEDNVTVVMARWGVERWREAFSRRLFSALR